jgi:3',5'-cyclic AMP phosphodiesterase CpdA
MPWAFAEAKRRGAKAFLFLGDLEITAAIDKRALPELAQLGNIPVYPVIGNHEIETLGIIRLPKAETELKVKKFEKEFLTVPDIHLAPFSDTAVYSVDLDGGIHFVALDNVSRKGEGFGAQQLAWLEEDLKTARAKGKVVLVGMHKGLANNPVTSHAMDEDGDLAKKDSESAIALFKTYKVPIVFVSHSHMYAAYTQGNDAFQVRLTGGMGAPLVRGLTEAEGGFHHFLLVDVSPNSVNNPILVEVVRFPCTAPCTPSKSELDEAQEND